MQIHDSGYKRLFSNHTIFRQLIESFVEEAWVGKLDFERAERIDKSFINEHYKETESDLIYKVPLRESEQVLYFYLLLEFQSTVQRFMAVRVLHYVSSFYLDYVQTQEGVKELPPLFPLVLYNGEERWTAPVQLAELLASEPALGPYGVQLRYFKVAENEYSRETLLAMRNIIATLFLAEAHYDIQVLYEPIVALFETEVDRQAVQVFMNWFEQLVVHGYRPASDWAILEREYATVEEVKSMLIKAIERDREQLLQLGEARGRAEGEARGRAEGEAQGRAERNRQIIWAMHKRDFASALIADIVGLSEQEVIAILRQVTESDPPAAPRRKRRSSTKKSN